MKNIIIALNPSKDKDGKILSLVISKKLQRYLNTQKLLY